MGAHPPSAISPRHSVVHQLAHRAPSAFARATLTSATTFLDDRISTPQRAAVQGTHQRIVPISRPFFGSTKSATLQFCSVSLSLRTDEQRKKKRNLWNGVMV